MSLRSSSEPDLTIHIDGGSRGNPGEAGFGVYVQAKGGAVFTNIAPDFAEGWRKAGLHIAPGRLAHGHHP